MKLKISEVKLNPDNPRTIKDANFKRLVQSIKDFPEMADVREVVVNKDYVILGGNMRFQAMKEAGWKEIPVKVVDWPEDKQREFVIKDNVSGGDWDWDLLANEWDSDLLFEWGVELPDYSADTDTPDPDPQPDDKNLQPYTLYFTNDEIIKILNAVEKGFEPRNAILEVLKHENY